MASAGSSALELENVEAGIGVRQIHETVAIDIAVAGLNHLRPVRAWIHHARGIGRYVESDFARLKRVLDVEGAHARIVIGGENQTRALERAGPVFVQIVRAEAAALGAIIRLRGLREGRDADRIAGLANVEHPDVAQSLTAVGEGRLLAEDEK